MITCMHQVTLDYVSGGSDKIYVIQVTRDSAATSNFFTTGYYGRRGARLAETLKYKGLSHADAMDAANRLEREKRAKGYSDMWVSPSVPVTGMPSTAPVFGGGSVSGSTATPAPAPAPTPIAAALVGFQPMLPSVADADRCEALLADPAYAAQRKYDGERVVISLRRSGIQATNLKGEGRPLTAAVESELTKLLAKPDFRDGFETLVDGEIMGDVVVLYDLMTLRDNDVCALPFVERFSALEGLLSGHEKLLALTAWTEAEKRAMLAKARAENWEGLIFRDMAAEYIHGRTLGVLKFKLWESATCRVLAANAKRSIKVGLVDEAGVEGFAGNVTVPVNMAIPAVGTLIEVRYLYAHIGGSLYQPTLLGIRSDKDVADLRSSLRPAPPEKSGSAVAFEADPAVA